MVTRTRRPRGFTLIELLVVIAVILLLAALSMPALNRVTRLARRVGCISNMRQMYVTLCSYSQNYGGYLPSSHFEYFTVPGLLDTVPTLRPYVSDPRIFYCTVRNVGAGALPNVDSAWVTGDFAGWNRYGQPNVYHVLSNIARYYNPIAWSGGSYGGYDGNVWPIGLKWRHPKAGLLTHRRVMRYDLKYWDPMDWRCQNWYPHGPYHDVTYGDGRNEGHSATEWQAKPRLWFNWIASDRCNIFY